MTMMMMIIIIIIIINFKNQNKYSQMQGPLLYLRYIHGTF